MPNPNLAGEAKQAINTAKNILSSKSRTSEESLRLQAEVANMQRRLAHDIDEREGPYIEKLELALQSSKNKLWTDFNETPKVNRAIQQQSAAQARFEELRAINEGSFPRNISPVVYVIPLIILGIAEWYVNYTTFLYTFVPAIAAALTILTAIIFATASHAHGAFTKQLQEILSPSAHYRQFLGNKIVIFVITIVLLAVFSAVMWLRYSALVNQLGLNNNSAANPFGGGDNSLVLQYLYQTAAFNIGIWALGAFYAFLMAERVPNLREAFRAMNRANAKVDSLASKPNAEIQRIDSRFVDATKANDTILQEYRSYNKQLHELLSDIRKEDEKK